jgi:hypothetical protein
MTDIKNAIGTGKYVIVPQYSIQYYDWYGDAYIIIDPATGAGGYMIAGGLAGGGTAQKNDLLAQVLHDLLGQSAFDLGHLTTLFLKISTPLINSVEKYVGYLGLFISAFSKYLEVVNETGSQLKGLEAFVVDFVLGLGAATLMGAFIAGLVTLIAEATGALAVITLLLAAIAVAFTILVIEHFLTNLITGKSIGYLRFKYPLKYYEGKGCVYAA